MKTKTKIETQLHEIYGLENIDSSYRMGLIIALTWVLDLHVTINPLTTEDLEKYQRKTNEQPGRI